MSLRVISYGGGVQSTALLVLAAQGRIDFQTFIMANVGDDSELPATLTYVRDVAMPYAAANGIDLHMLQRTDKSGQTHTLYGDITAPGSKAMKIPVRMSGGKPASRSCTVDYKTRVTGKWLRAHGASKTNPAVVGIGISLDEIQRANTSRAMPWEQIVYPLIGIGEETGLRLRRDDCARIIRDAGLDVPPKSSCYFCPFHRLATWTDLARDEPDLFAKACDLEDFMRNRSEVAGRGPVWMTDYAMPLSDLVNTDQLPLPDSSEAGCDSGRCWL
jgi:hypothetical protein